MASSVVRLVSSMIGEVCRVMEKDMERHEKLCCGLKSIKNEMELVKGLIKEECPGALQEIRIRHLQDLAYDVEDFLESLWQPGVYGRKVLVCIGMDPRPPQLVRIEYFEKTIKSLKQEWEKSSESATESSNKAVDATSDSSDWDAAAAELEAMDVHKAKIRELLSPSPGEEQRLRVLSIVGCRGVGKTALAGAVYQDCLADHTNAFDCVAWVVASGCTDKNSLLDKISQGVQVALASRRTEADGDYSGTALQDILSKKRCLVFIDDVRQAQVWKDTVDACLSNDSRSRIVVTTSVRSVAKACSSGSYVYNMQCLSNDESRRLLWRKVYGNNEEPPYALEMASENIFTKCGGLPLALTSVAKHLILKGDDLDSNHFEEVGQNLGKDYLSGNNNDAVSAFRGIRRVLTQCYDNLPDYEHRLFFLYLSIFPRGQHIKRKSLVRRLIAEGLVVNEGSCKCFDQLVDHCIVKPVQISNNLVVAKSYQVHDVVLEYIIDKSLDKNLVITLVEGREPLDVVGSNGHSVRRLCVQSGIEISFDEHKDTLRSLTMFETEPSELHSCKLLRLLDLEGCTDLEQSFLDGLSKLLLLRYLSLRNTGISQLPAHMENLQRLEMLDIRETNVENLPIKAIMLPKLAYLFGRFRLESTSNAKEINKLSEFMKKKSVLHTVSGYVANETQGPEHVILLARNLKKVKVWCNQTRANNTITHHGSRSMGMRYRRTREGTTQCDSFDFIKLLKMRFTSLESVSIVSASGFCNDFMGSLGGPCTIGSIKLRGNLDSLPDPHKLINLGRIKKMQLFSTGLSISNLSALQYLRGLEYLKLVEHSDTFYDGILVVEANRFESLKSLYIEAINVPRMQFRQGAMKSLTSLHLLCPNVSPMQPPSETIEGILHLANLSEVILHRSMQPEWDGVADGHRNRPSVKRQPEETANIAA
ncbi:hypothetical protein BS78_05G270000 [Paspalum vaginatum]|nr:hypothetical protein BS78_05G270000 [Paspalum vaginatum]